jgi:hypothetical protein
MRLARRFVLPAVTATAVLVILLSVSKLSTSRALAIWVVLLTGLILLVLLRYSREFGGPEPVSRFEQALHRREHAARQPEELLRMDRELVLGSADADHAQRRLLPLLRATAAARISTRHGFELERRPEAARALLGEEAWELLRPDRPAPEDRHGPGVPRKSIVAVIERVESL